MNKIQQKKRQAEIEAWRAAKSKDTAEVEALVQKKRDEGYEMGYTDGMEFGASKFKLSLFFVGMLMFVVGFVTALLVEAGVFGVFFQ